MKFGIPEVAMKVVASFAAITLVLVAPVAAGASPEPGRGEIAAFVERVHDRWGVTIDPANYEIATVDGVTVIRPKGAPVDVRPDDPAGDALETSVLVAPPAVSASGARLMKKLADPDWYEPTCFARVTDDEKVGRMDACAQFGEMNFSGATRRNVAFRMYASCWVRGDSPLDKEIDDCYVASKRGDNSGKWYWNDWNPRSKLEVGNCQDVTLTIGFGGVGAEHLLRACDTLIPVKGEAGGDFRVTWEGALYHDGDMRETAMLIGIGHDWNDADVGLGVAFGYHYSDCGHVPWDPCKF